MAELGEIMSEVITTPVAEPAPTAPITSEAAPELAPIPPAATPEVPKVDEKFAAKFAALSRQERHLKQQSAEIARQKADIAQREKEWQARINAQESELGQYKAFKDKFTANPLSAAAEAGYDFEKLAQIQANDQNPTPEMLIQRVQKQLDDKYSKQLEELKAQLAEKEQRTQTQQVDAAKKAYLQNIQMHVQENGDKYELIANTPYEGQETSAQLVLDVVEEFFNKNQRVLDVSEASDMVEKHLETEELKRREKLKKFKQTSTPAAATKSAAKSTAPTLSNSLTQESPKNGPKPMSREESLREAAKLIRWED